MKERCRFSVLSLMMAAASCGCFLAALRLDSFSDCWEALVIFGFCTNPMLHRLVRNAGLARDGASGRNHSDDFRPSGDREG